MHAPTYTQAELLLIVVEYDTINQDIRTINPK